MNEPSNAENDWGHLSRRNVLKALPLAGLGAASTVSVFGAQAQGQAAASAKKSLYERLGGYDAISAVVEDFAARLFGDPKINMFFRGMSTDTKESFKQKNKNLLVNVTGGPAIVISRPAKTAHAGLNITMGDFQVVAGHLKETLEKFHVPEREMKEVFAIVATLQPDIVERKSEKLSREIDS